LGRWGLSWGQGMGGCFSVRKGERVGVEWSRLGDASLPPC